MITIQVFPLPGEVANMINLYQSLLSVIADKLTQSGMSAKVNSDNGAVEVETETDHAIRALLLDIPEVYELEPSTNNVLKVHVIAYRLRPHGRKPEQADLLAWVANNLTNVVSAELVGDDKLVIEFSSGVSITLTVYSAARN